MMVLACVISVSSGRVLLPSLQDKKKHISTMVLSLDTDKDEGLSLKNMNILDINRNRHISFKLLNSAYADK